MKNPSPLRYPGGKSVMASLLAQIRDLNGLGSRSIAEPFAGGAGASLSLLYLEETHEIFINDADNAIHDFWWALIHQANRFIEMLTKKRVSMAEWFRQRDLYRHKSHLSRLIRGFATFYLNRCNHSGIIMNGGPIGGIKQQGPWKLNARFNKQELRQRCEKLSDYASRIHVSCKDGVDFIEMLSAKSTFFFVDPPYYVKGKTLYLNALGEEYHNSLATKLKTMSDEAWVLTYDDCPAIRRMYRGWTTIKPFSLRYSASDQRKGNEVLIVPKWMRLPKTQKSIAIDW